MKYSILAGAVAAVVVVPLGAQAADMPIYKAQPPVQVFSWTGCYIGGNVGGKTASNTGAITVAPTTAGGGFGALPGTVTELAHQMANTPIYGGQVGCNWQSGSWVFGLEGDYDAQRWSTDRTFAGTPAGTSLVVGDTYNIRSRWEASARARLGYAFDRTLFYVTGGAAWTEERSLANFIATVSGGLPFPADVTEARRTRVGATVGAGLEYAYTNNWTLGLEGRYTWYGTENFAGGNLAVQALPPAAAPTLQFAATALSYKVSTAEAMVKLNYKFW